MIFIVVKYEVKPEHVDQWLERTREFTEATRAEPGNNGSSGTAAASRTTSSPWWRPSMMTPPQPT